MRTRGNFVCYVDGTEAPGVSAVISAGFLVVPEGTGTTVISEPFGDANAPWFWHTQFVVGYEEMVTDVVDIAGLPVYRETVDSKAMRRIRSDQEIQFVVTNTTLIAALSVNLSLDGRMLLGS